MITSCDFHRQFVLTFSNMRGAFHFNHNWWDCMESIKSHCYYCFFLSLALSDFSPLSCSPYLPYFVRNIAAFIFISAWGESALVKLWAISPSNRVLFAQHQTRVSCLGFGWEVCAETDEAADQGLIWKGQRRQAKLLIDGLQNSCKPLVLHCRCICRQYSK